MTPRPRRSQPARPSGQKVRGSIEKKAGYPSAPSSPKPPKPPTSSGPGAPPAKDGGESS
jgi:hypothetical protein